MSICVSSDKVYVVKINDDLTIKLTWDGCARYNHSLGCEEFLMTDEDGIQIAVPADALADAIVEDRQPATRS